MKTAIMIRALYRLQKIENILKISFVLIISALATSGCFSSDNEEDVYDISIIPGTMEAKINGELIVFEEVNGVAGSFNLDNSCNEPFIGIDGKMNLETPDKHRIVLYFPPSQGVGTYDMDATYWKGGDDRDVLATPYYKRLYLGPYPDFPTNYEEEGEVTITSAANGRYKGTFHFTAWSFNEENFVITDGKFDIDQESELGIRFCN